MPRPVSYVSFAVAGVGTAEYRVFLAPSLQAGEESRPNPAPPDAPSLPTQDPDKNDRPHRWRKVLSGATTVLLIIVLCFLVAVGYGLIDNRWYHVLSVEGGSMQPTIAWGDLIVITKPPKELKPGMIVTMQVKDKIVTHRVLQVDPLVTQGDANGAPDAWKAEDVRVVGVVKLSIPWLGQLLDRVHLTGYASNAFFRSSRGMPGEVSAGEWAMPEMALESPAVSADPAATVQADTDPNLPPPSPDTSEPFSEEPTSTTTTTTTEPTTDTTEPSLDTPPPTVEYGTETTPSTEGPGSTVAFLYHDRLSAHDL